MATARGPHAIAGPLALSRATLDRAAGRRSDPEWLAAAWADPRSRVVQVGAGRALGDTDGLRLVPSATAPLGERYLLGVDGEGAAYFAVHLPDGPPPGDSVSLREAGALLPDRDAGLFAHAAALSNWHAAHRHCARCGAGTEVAAAGHVRRCPADGSEHYPRTDPAVIMLVIDPDDRALLGRQASWPDRRFSALAGFVEPGESCEQALIREVAEETGIVVSAPCYAGSQPWPFPSSLMLAFFASSPGGTPRPDGHEIVEARWFSRHELQDALAAGEITLPASVSIARKLVEGWYGGPLPDGA